ncbi:MAG: secretin N-terminal domain-containing protein [Burkholderiales bacterium]|nr:secretin N-terminal domain-containing protein [Burkholderiales bacterium]
MKRLIIATIVIALAGCADVPQRRDTAYDRITQELDAAQTRVKPATPEAVSQAMLPPLVVEMPRPEAQAAATRFDLNVNNAPANQVFMAMVSGTRYSMVVHPDVRQPVSLNLKDVTVFEALDTIRELYGYEYRVQGTRIVVQPMTLQTRVFHVNYLQAVRRGQTEVRVSSGSITDSPSGGAAPAPAGAITSPGPVSRPTESTRVTTTSASDFWSDVSKSINAIVGGSEGRNVIVNPQSGIIVVRALPAELRSVESFLKAMQLVVERQVVLEAKIIEVTQREGFEAGINWSACRDGRTRFGAGVITPGAELNRGGVIGAPTRRGPDGSVLPDSAIVGGTLGGGIASGLALGSAAAGGIFGLALQTANFAALLSFLETQGTANVLSSPRVATLNNQKAVLKVGTDEFFVTNVTTTSTTSGAATTIAPTITVQPFFSGIALDVTPQIDENNNIILHIHPAVSSVIEKRKIIDLGSLGTFTLPLASSDVNETDTIVRVQDGNIVAIGGLMREQTVVDRSQVPGVGNAPGIGNLFRQRSNTTLKSELVILLKPTIIHSDRNWQEDLVQTRDRIRAMGAPEPQR